MDAYSIRDAAERLDVLVGRVEAGESVELSREGRIVARMVPVALPDTPPQPERFDWAAYRRSIGGMPVHPGNSVVDMRKEARY